MIACREASFKSYFYVKKVPLPLRTWEIVKQLVQMEAERTGKDKAAIVNRALIQYLRTNPKYRDAILKAFEQDDELREMKDMLIETLGERRLTKRRRG